MKCFVAASFKQTYPFGSSGAFGSFRESLHVCRTDASVGLQLISFDLQNLIKCAVQKKLYTCQASNQKLIGIISFKLVRASLICSYHWRYGIQAREGNDIKWRGLTFSCDNFCSDTLVRIPEFFSRNNTRVIIKS